MLSGIWDAMKFFEEGTGGKAKVLAGHPDDQEIGWLAAKEFGLFWVTRSYYPVGQFRVMDTIPQDA